MRRDLGLVRAPLRSGLVLALVVGGLAGCAGPPDPGAVAKQVAPLEHMALLRDIYDHTEDYVYGAPSVKTGLNGLRTNSQCTLTFDGKAMVLRVTGADPVIVFPGIGVPGERKLMLRLEVTSPKATTAQMECSGPDSAAPVLSPVYPVAAGENVLYLEALTPQRDGAALLHLGKGTEGAELRIQTLEGRAAPR